uniref:Uncharacterized protein n=1 Tax=Leersia perrieri TaxID=77586 RepID=A0A0D9WSN3_9ORYZ
MTCLLSLRPRGVSPPVYIFHDLSVKLLDWKSCACLAYTVRLFLYVYVIYIPQLDLPVSTIIKQLPESIFFN